LQSVSTSNKELDMNAKELKMMLAGIGLAGLLAGASLTAAPAEAQTGSG
jgi:radical SAM modification target selenobiotic family peptide